MDFNTTKCKKYFDMVPDCTLQQTFKKLHLKKKKRKKLHLCSLCTALKKNIHNFLKRLKNISPFS